MRVWRAIMSQAWGYVNWVSAKIQRPVSLKQREVETPGTFPRFLPKAVLDCRNRDITLKMQASAASESVSLKTGFQNGSPLFPLFHSSMLTPVSLGLEVLSEIAMLRQSTCRDSSRRTLMQ